MSARADRYNRDLNGSWAVLSGADGEIKPDRWATREDAVEFGLLGRYLLSGYDVIRLPRVGIDQEDSNQ